MSSKSTAQISILATAMKYLSTFSKLVDLNILLILSCPEHVGDLAAQLFQEMV